MSEPPVRFGTDGVRGRANTVITPELVLALGRAAGSTLGDGPVLIGRDPRRSGSLLESALAAGLAAEGRDVVRVGVTSTPALAWLAARDGVAAAMLSASHNPFGDNGVKLFAPGGTKLGDDQQADLERVLGVLYADRPAPEPADAAVGAVTDHPDPHSAYLAWLGERLEGRDLTGLRLVVDCANGSASAIAPIALRATGADVVVVAAEPDGVNINRNVGSTAPDLLSRRVLDEGAHLGLALDGDADRLLAVDERGRLVDGDHLLALFAADLRARGRLADDTVVVTVMSNLGFRLAMQEAGVEVVETPVGDRHVLAELEANRWSLGGEQSGHLVFRDLATTGDGLLSGLLLCDLVRRSGRPFGELADEAMTQLPQVLVNVAVDAAAIDLDETLGPDLADVEHELGERGRVLVRPSGTEPVVRVMVEAPTETAARAAADRLAAVLRASPAALSS
ncbi:MAG: phosphoglucosamine mutase [Actinomycetota bacterium]